MLLPVADHIMEGENVAVAIADFIVHIAKTMAVETGSGRTRANKPTLHSPCLLADWEGIACQGQSEPTCTEVARKSVGSQGGSSPNAPNTLF